MDNKDIKKLQEIYDEISSENIHVNMTGSEYSVEKEQEFIRLKEELKKSDQNLDNNNNK